MDAPIVLNASGRELSISERAVMAAIRAQAKEVGELVVTLQATTADQRWVNIAKTELQQGFMALIRAVAKPDVF